MKNVEWLSKKLKINLHPKFEKLISDTNLKLRQNLNNKEILEQIKTNFYKLKRFAQFNIHKIKTADEFSKFLAEFEIVFKDLEIEKLYNDATIKHLNEFEKLDLFRQFFYIATPIYNNSNLDFIKGGICYHWALFFYNLFSEIDKENKLKKELALFTPEYNHGVFVLSFSNTKVIIDPYSKSLGLVNPVIKGRKVYLGAVFNNLIFWEIIDEENITLKVNETEIITPKIFTNKQKFIENINYTFSRFLNIKTFVEGKPTWLQIRETKDTLLINFNWQILEREKLFIKDDVVFLFMEKWEVSTYEILLAILGLKENFLNTEIKKSLKVLAKKIPKDHLIEKLELKDVIEMFKEKPKN